MKKRELIIRHPIVCDAEKPLAPHLKPPYTGALL
jgi:hypothetical protein